MPKKELPKDARPFYAGSSHKEAFGLVIFFTVLLYLIFSLTDGFPKSKLLVIHPREIFSLPAIFLSNFFHANRPHLISNLIIFFPFGYWVFRQEGARGVTGILIGMITGGVLVWLFAGRGIQSAGFSGAVFACLGILIVRSIRTSALQTIFLALVIGTILDSSFFDTIRPTKLAINNNISWLGHLGGLLGGMASQIRSLPIALEMLYRQNKVTEEEFILIATRIHEGTMDFTPDENFNREQAQESNVAAPENITNGTEASSKHDDNLPPNPN